MTGAELVRQIEDLKAIRRPLEYHKRECYKFTYPVRGVMYAADLDQAPEEIQAQATAMQAAIYDSTAADSCTILGSTLISNMTPANGLWFGLETGDDETAEVKKWLDKLVRDVHQGIHASNYDAPGFEALLDVIIGGECALYIEEGDDTDYIFDAWPITHCWFASSKKGGVVDIIFYQFNLSALQAMKEYGYKCPSKITEAATKNPYQRFPFFQAIMPRPVVKGKPISKKEELQPFASYHVCMTSKKIVRDRGYGEFPVAAPRWMKLPGSPYAQGPMSLALPDTKTLNEAERLILANADWQVSGMWGAVDDGVLNPKTVKIGPRKVVFMRSKDSFFPIKPPGKVEIGEALATRKQGSIRRVLMADQMQPLEQGPARTAAEWHYRIGLIRSMMGPMFGRLQSEFLQRIVFRCAGIKIRRDIRKGILPPAEIADKVLRLRYVSPLARAQQLEEVAAMDRYESGLVQKAQIKPELIDIYDWDAAERRRGEALGVPSVLILDVKKVKEARKLREDKAAAAAGAANGAGAPQQGAMPPAIGGPTNA